jgi:hypothetical protein
MIERCRHGRNLLLHHRLSEAMATREIPRSPQSTRSHRAMRPAEFDELALALWVELLP